jgi:ketosteroid isomerase-like protein
MVVILLTGCMSEPANDVSGLLAADNAFSQMSVDKGLNAAFLFYADDSVVKMRDDNFPIIGKAEMSRNYRARSDRAMILKWTPLKAEVSKSDDLGYTFGNWELYLKESDTSMYGNYVSIWKKQKDGSWKYVLDAGCNTPRPILIHNRK